MKPVVQSSSSSGTTETDAPLLAVDDLSVTFPTDDGPAVAVEDVSFSLEAGESLGVVGESGSGKSVTSMAMLGLLPRTAKVSGSIRFMGRELVGLRDSELRELRGNRVSMVFQDALSALNPVITVGDQLAEAISVHDREGVGKRELRERSIELLDLVGVSSPSHQVDLYPHEFSGGMRQRVLIAMGVANEPDLLIADEPTTALDVTVQAQVLDVLQRIQERTRTALMLITHDLGVVARLVDRVMVMYAGSKIEDGPVDQIFYQTAHPYTRGLLASLPRHDRREDPNSRLFRIPGQLPNTVERPGGCLFYARCSHGKAGVCDQARPEPDAVGAGHTASCWRLNEIGPT